MIKRLIDAIIEGSVRNRFVVLLVVVVVAVAGVYNLYRTPVDAIPDLSENQVIVWADWEGRSPHEVEDQITYPLSVNLQGLAGVKSVRASSEFGFSMINVIFEDRMDVYFTRQRVLERLSTSASVLPPGVVPYMAPDATALGQVFWYTVEGKGKGLDELRAIQDWYVRYQLNAVPGVAQVASVGGFVREYQIDVDPQKLRAYDVSLGQVFRAVMSSNSSVGGKVIEKGGAEYLVRGYGWIRDIDDIRNVIVVERNGQPITVDRVAAVQIGPAFRRSVLEKGGDEAVGGVVMMRCGENPLEVTERVKKRIAELQLPEGVRVVPFYDRTGLIESAVGTLAHTLVEEILIASLVVLLVLWHLRSAFVICVTLPLSVLVSFIFMRALGVSSNIMSLSGIAISIGVLVDAGIVITENAYHRLHDRFQGGTVVGDTREVVIEACKVVGAPLFFSIVIMLLSFAPVFALGGREGKMFNPLAYTKSFALVGVALLAITLVPALIPTFVRGRLRSQEEVWLVRSFADIYRPMLSFFMRRPDVIVVMTGAILVLGLPIFPHKVPWIFFVAAVPFLIAFTALFLAKRPMTCLLIVLGVAIAGARFLSPLGEEFMPALDELAIMDMPTSTPTVNITQAGDDIKERDRLLREFPEVHQVVGKIGRADTPTDPAPIEMVETVVSMRPRDLWPRRKVNYEDALAWERAVRAALEAKGVLIPHDERRKRLDAAIAGARKALERLAEVMPGRPRREVAYPDTLGEATTAWGQLVDSKSVPADEAAAAIRDLGLASPVFSHLRTAAPPGSAEMGVACRWAAGVLSGDVSHATEAHLREEDEALENDSTMEAIARFDRSLRETCMRRLGEDVPWRTQELVRLLRARVVELQRRSGRLKAEPPQAAWVALDADLTTELGPVFDQWIPLEDVQRACQRVADFLVRAGAVDEAADLLVEPENRWDVVLDPLRALVASGRPTFFQRLRDDLERKDHDLRAAFMKRLDGELLDRAPHLLAGALAGETLAKAKAAGLLSRDARAEEIIAVHDEATRSISGGLFLWQKLKSDVQTEMDSELQVPGWSNIWTEPIINRVNMLATGVRTMIGLKVFGDKPENIQPVVNQIAEVVKHVHGAVDVFAEQSVGKDYIEISIDRKRAARYGVSVEQLQDVIEVALGGKEITMTVEGRQRFPVRVRYPRNLRMDEEAVKQILVPAGGESMGQGSDGGTAPAMGALPPAKTATGGRRLAQVPLSLVADVRVVKGPSMLRSENGLLVSYLTLNVRDRDIVGFVEEAQAAVAAKVKVPPGFHTEWSGEFEHQINAQKTITLVMPFVILIIFVILFLSYGDFADTLMMFLAVPGAIAGGAIFQFIWGYHFSVAVWIGYIACFGLAAETGIVMLVYLREALENRERAGLVRTEEDIHAAVMEGAVNRLRPKLLTEGTIILALIPMLWATGVGSEFMRPMAAPILGGVLVADEVIDILIPVLFYKERCRRLRRRASPGAEAAPNAERA